MVMKFRFMVFLHSTKAAKYRLDISYKLIHFIIIIFYFLTPMGMVYLYVYL